MKGNTPYLVVNGLMKHYGNGEARVRLRNAAAGHLKPGGDICCGVPIGQANATVRLWGGGS